MIQKNVPLFRFKKRWSKWKVDFENQLQERKLPPNKRLRIGVVGGGDIGVRNAKSVQAAPAAIIAAVCDINLNILWDLAKCFEVAAIPEYKMLLDRPDVDAVLLSVPHFLHSSFTEQAAKAGKHVLLEKPLGVNLQDATRIIEACRKAGVRLTVNFSFRYRPSIELVRQLIQSEVLGKVCGTQINLFQFKGASYWAGGYLGRASGEWRASKEKAGGGVLINTICHAVDFLRYCTGLEVIRTFSEYGTFNSQIDVEDSIVATLQYNNGAIGSITAATFWRESKQDEVRIWGTHGALKIEENSKLTLWSSRRWKNLAPGKVHNLNSFPDVDYTSEWINRFALAVANNEPHEIAGKDGWINNAVIEAAYNSRELRRPVEVQNFSWEGTQ
jgi:predicted dehydrogenase